MNKFDSTKKILLDSHETLFGLNSNAPMGKKKRHKL